MPKKYIKYALAFAAITWIIAFASVFLFTSEAFAPRFVFTKTGEIGDTIGGITAPIIGVIGAALTFLAFFIQYKANEKHNLQFDLQSKAATKDKYDSKIIYLIQQNRDIANSMSIGEKDRVTGSKCFNRMFAEFRAAYEICNSIFSESLKKQEILNISYAIFYNGIGTMSDEINKSLLGESEELVLAGQVFASFKDNYNDPGMLSALTLSYGINFDESIISNLEYVPFDGHTTRLGQYFRNLFHILSYTKSIDEGLMSFEEKKELIKSLRSQLSSYEQILIYFNSLSFYGLPLRENGFINDFKLIKNIPIPLVEFFGDIHEYYPDIDFEWDEIIKRAKST